jgi:hypothetical protein
MMHTGDGSARRKKRVAIAGATLALASTGIGAAERAGPPSIQDAPSEIVVYVSELPRRALSEFRFWEDPASPGGRLVGYPNTGDELDPPPENDPHLTFTVQVQAGVGYRCWVHMKVGEPGGKSQANMLWVQFTGAVNEAGATVLAPRTGSYLTARGPTTVGWTWVGCDPEAAAIDQLVRFDSTGEITVRIQAGMEGVGFDQFVLSPARYLDHPPSQAVVPKSDSGAHGWF